MRCVFIQAPTSPVFKVCAEFFTRCRFLGGRPPGLAHFPLTSPGGAAAPATQQLRPTAPRAPSAQRAVSDVGGGVPLTTWAGNRGSAGPLPEAFKGGLDFGRREALAEPACPEFGPLRPGAPAQGR